MKRSTWVWLGTVALMPASAAAQVATEAEAEADPATSAFELTVANIMRGPEHVGERPSGIRWSDDGEWVYFEWKPGGLAWDAPEAMYRVRADGGEPERLDDVAADSLGVLIAPGTRSEDDRWRAVAHNGDLYLIDSRSLDVRQLTATRARESSPVFSRDGTALYFVRDGDVFDLTLDGGAVRQVTDVRAGPPPSEREPPAGQRAFMDEQQQSLFEHIRRQIEEREREEARDSLRRERAALKPVYLERNERAAAIAIEPDGRYALLRTERTSDDDSARSTVIPEWVTESGYTETREVRTKVGDIRGPSGRVGVLSVADGSVSWLDVDAAAATVSEDTAKRPGARGVSFLGWNEDGTAGLIGAASDDFKDAWLWTFDAGTGELDLVTHHHDEAWVAGPCAFWFGCAGWLPDGRTVYFVSERDGYAHLYTATIDGSAPRQLTSGPWEVHSVEVSPDRERFYLQTNEESPHEQHFYHMAFDGSDRERITTMSGRQDATPSPDGRRVAFVHSFANQPPDLFIAENRAGAEPRRITTSPTEEWQSFPWLAPEIVHVPASDGVQVPARIYRPEQLGAEPNGAAVIFVHGAGYLQNVHNWWSSYYREYMFHHLLAARGYVVLDIDYRGSAGYGRDWRTAIYRHMGGQDLSDQVDGSRYLTENFGIDPERIGIYGGSYGGFITLMALFNSPERFGAGAALRSVTDWAHYNHGYTGRILNLPQDDTLAYTRSSPIYFADGLEDPLLIAHGMVDSNVHFSDVVRLAQRLIELGKRNWEMAVYPVENHGFAEPSSWTDEYRRILELFERHINPRGDPASVQ